MWELKDEPRIKINGVDGIFILMTKSRDNLNGPVTTQEDFDNFVPGYGHMYDGVIRRYGKEVCGPEGWHFVVEADDKVTTTASSDLSQTEGSQNVTNNPS